MPFVFKAQARDPNNRIFLPVLRVLNVILDHYDIPSDFHYTSVCHQMIVVSLPQLQFSIDSPMSEDKPATALLKRFKNFSCQSITRVVALQLEIHTTASVVNVVAWATCW